MDVGAMSVSVDDSSLGTEEENPILHDPGISKVTSPLYVHCSCMLLLRAD